jgi:transcriptional regulator with XRE-family HTH domain
VRPTGEWLVQPGGLADRLRDLRRASGLTGDQLAALAGWPRSKIPKLENGRQMPSEADIRAWTQATGHPDAAGELLDLLSEGQAVHRRYRLRVKDGLTGIQEEMETLEKAAKRIRVFEVAFIPGLLQTEDYARARLAEASRTYEVADVEASVAARMRRQAVLFTRGKVIEFVITEAALRFLVCPPDVMLRQLERLQVHTTSATIPFGIIPFGVELAVAPVAGFQTFDDKTLVEAQAGDEKVTARESADYDRIFEELAAEAVVGAEARRLISAAAADLREKR